MRTKCILLLIALYGFRCAAAQEADLTQQVVVTTSAGTFVLALYADKAPLHARLFLNRIAAGSYDGTSFGYLVKWGLIQGGRRLSGKEGPPPSDPVVLTDVRAERPELKHGRGTLSLVLDQAESFDGQFFICVQPQPALDDRYTPIGVVVEGIEIIDRISESPADPKGIPVQAPRIEKMALRPSRPVPALPFAETSVQELARYQATLETTLGNITIEFRPDLAPNHVRNFLRLAQAGFYDGTAIHRVVRDFVMQGGMLSTRQPPLPDFRQADLVRKMRAEFSPVHHEKGIVSMARYDDPDSAETSFFICLGNGAGSLDGEYTVFGRVVSGMEVLDKFQEVPVDGEAPKERIELKRVTIRSESRQSSTASGRGNRFP